MASVARLKKPMIALAVSLLMLPIGEVLVRLFTETSPPLVLRDATIGRRFVPGFQGEVYDKESERAVPLRFNELGFRGPDRPIEAPANTLRVAVIGDSMVAALAMNEEDTLTAQLGARLRSSHPGVQWETMNFGVLGSSTAQETLIYTHAVRPYSPDLVVLCFFSGNDLSDNHRGLTSNPRIYYDFNAADELVQLPFSVKRTGFSRWLNLNSRLYVWQKELLRGGISRASSGPGGMRPADWIFAEDPPPVVARAWRITKALIERLKRDVEADGGVLVLAPLPSAKQIYTDIFAGVLARSGQDAELFHWNHPDEHLANMCSELALPMCSLTAPLREAAPSASVAAQDEWLFYQGTGHWNARANGLGATHLHTFLTEADEASASLIDQLLDR